MKLFHKTTQNNIQTPAQNTPQTTQQTTQNTTPTTPEQEARQWFQQQFNTDMPEQITRMFKQIARNETAKQKTSRQTPDPAELKRIDDKIRLLKTKLINIAQTTNSLKAQKDWLLKYNDLKLTLEKLKQQQNEAAKAYNERLNDINNLELFEQLEPIYPNYQSIKIKQHAIETLHNLQTQATNQLTQEQTILKNTKKQADEDNKKLLDTIDNLTLMRTRLEQAYTLQATNQQLTQTINNLNKIKEHTQQLLQNTTEQTTENLQNTQNNKQQAEQLQQIEQNIAPLQQMVENADILLYQLDVLQYITTQKNEIQNNLKQSLKQKQEYNELLGKLFTTSQELDEKTNTLQSELRINLTHIVGMNSYNLQQRAMNLKSKCETLQNALNIWKQITDGYTRIEETTHNLMRINANNEQLIKKIEQLTPEVQGLKKHVEETTYAYTLSKGRDIIQLRSDLQEGVSCSVCGATHHPFHSDTLLEQSRLIAEFKKQYEQATTELNTKQTTLLEITQEQIRQDTTIKLTTQTLQTYKQILQDNIQHWQTFTTLDRTFQDCTPNTNFQARNTMLQQMLEKTTIDAQQAQNELDTFNKHQTNINKLNKEIAQTKQQRDELSTRLNETNTACQVIAYKTDELQKQLTQITELHTKIIDSIDKKICIGNWQRVWNNTPENLRTFIRDQHEQWNKLNNDKKQNHENNIQLTTAGQILNQNEKHLQKQADDINDKLKQLAETIQTNNNTLQKILPDTTAQQAHTDTLQKLTQDIQTHNESQKQNTEQLTQTTQVQTHLDTLNNLIKQLQNQTAEEKAQLDMWIKKYNTQHSPIRFEEITTILDNRTDRNTQRNKLRKLKLNHLLATSRTDEARLSLAAHQVNSPGAENNPETRAAYINTEIARLDAERDNTLQQIAALKAQINTQTHTTNQTNNNQ